MATTKPSNPLRPPWAKDQPEDPNQPYFAPSRSALENEQAVQALSGGPTEGELAMANQDLESVQQELGEGYYGTLGGDPGRDNKREVSRLRAEFEALKRKLGV